MISDKEGLMLSRRVAIGTALGMLVMPRVGFAGLSRSAALGIRASGRDLSNDATPSLVWRYLGDQAWQTTRAKAHAVKRVGPTLVLVGDFGPVRATVRARRTGPKSWSVSGSLLHTGGAAVELARFNYLDGNLADGDVGLLGIQAYPNTRRYVRGEKVPPRTQQWHEIWTKWDVVFGTLSDPIYDVPDWGTSRDIGTFARDWDSAGWTIGFTGPGDAFGELGFHTDKSSRQFFAGVLLDNVLFEAGENRTIETMTVHHGDWQMALSDWVEDVARAIPPRPIRPAMVGYCSWYQRADKVDLADMQRANTEFAAWPVPPGGRLVQLDDGWQVMPGDWRANAKFKQGWAALPHEIAATGSVPGLWTAPTVIHQDHPVLRQHPEWIQRRADGKPAIHFANWGGESYYLDSARPEVKKFIREAIAQHRAEGWRYLKVDFTYGIAGDRIAYDRKQTTHQLLRGIFQTVREGAGPDIFVNACIGYPGRYAVGLADVTRVFGDVNTRWETVKFNLLPLLLYAPTNGRWWQADPDVFYMRREGSTLNAEESNFLMGTIGLMGGLFVTSDWPSQWDEAALAQIGSFWTREGPRLVTEQRIVVDADGLPLAYRVTHADGAPKHRLGLYNWADTPRALQLDLSRAGLAGKRLAPGQSGFRIEGTTLFADVQPGHSLRIADFV